MKVQSQVQHKCLISTITGKQNTDGLVREMEIRKIRFKEKKRKIRFNEYNEIAF